MVTATALQQKASSTPIPTLDGWRGLAILLVLIEHAQTTLRGGPILNTGQHGVTIFLVLSGFLITTKLIEAPIDLRRFYTRRFFRLIPAAWAYLAFVAVCDLIFQQHRISGYTAAGCLLFFRNYIASIPAGATGHFWSLSLEEQFYLAWPILLLFAGVKRCRWLAVSGIFGCTLWRYAHWSFYNRVGYDYRAEVRADALLVGCLLAILMSGDDARAFLGRWAKWWALPALAGMIYYILRYTWLPPLGESICIAALIAAGVQYPHHRFAQWLDVWPLAPLGVMSYSIYVWQQYFFEIRRGPLTTPLMMAAMPIFALLSYHWIEQPCRRLGYRLTSCNHHYQSAGV